MPAFAHQNISPHAWCEFRGGELIPGLICNMLQIKGHTFTMACQRVKTMPMLKLADAASARHRYVEKGTQELCRYSKGVLENCTGEYIWSVRTHVALGLPGNGARSSRDTASRIRSLARLQSTSPLHHPQRTQCSAGTFNTRL